MGLSQRLLECRVWIALWARNWKEKLRYTPYPKASITPLSLQLEINSRIQEPQHGRVPAVLLGVSVSVCSSCEPSRCPHQYGNLQQD